MRHDHKRLTASENLVIDQHAVSVHVTLADRIDVGSTTVRGIRFLRGYERRQQKDGEYCEQLGHGRPSYAGTRAVGNDGLRAANQ